MPVQTIEEWAVRLRVAVAAREFCESVAQLTGRRRELDAAVDEARVLGIAVEPVLGTEFAEAGR